MTRLHLALAAALTLALVAPARAQDGTAGDTPPRPAKLLTLEAGEDRIARQFYGRIEARETVDLAFQVGGQIVEFPATEGASIPAARLVAQLDLEPFRRRLEEARVNLAKAERDLARLEALSRSAASEVQREDARTQVSLAEIAVADAEDRLEDATLNAPFDALVARRMVANFSTVEGGTPVVRMHDMSEKRVAIEVPEVLFRRAAGGENVDLYATFPGDDTRYGLVPREFEAETAEVGQTFRLTLAFTEDPGEWVLPGSSTTVTALSGLGVGSGVLLPETALVFDADRTPAVMVFEPDDSPGGGAGTDGAGDAAQPGDDGAATGTVTRTPVEIEMRSDGKIGLVSGPPTGTEIVATGAAQLSDGQRVRRFTGIGEQTP